MISTGIHVLLLVLCYTGLIIVVLPALRWWARRKGMLV